MQNKRCLKRSFYMFFAEERGVSMIMIVILLAFLSILLSVLMTSTMFNFQMKTSYVSQKNNAYQASFAAEQIRYQIGKKAEAALRQAYMEQVQTGGFFSEEGQAAFSDRYQALLKKQLKIKDSSTTYSQHALVKTSGNGIVVKENTGAPLSFLEDRILLQDFELEVKDDTGYKTSVTFDIALLFPDRAYMSEHAVMEIKDLVVYENYEQN